MGEVARASYTSLLSVVFIAIYLAMYPLADEALRALGRMACGLMYGGAWVMWHQLINRRIPKHRFWPWQLYLALHPILSVYQLVLMSRKR